MQEKRDDLDGAIFEAFRISEPDADYNERLIKKLHDRNFSKQSNIKPIAVGLILSGIMSMMLYTSDVQFKLLDFKYKVVSDVLAVQYNYKNDLQKLIFGEWRYNE